MRPLEQIIFSVSSLTSAARQLLETQFAAIWVEGEISNLACPSSGHAYFSLKDHEAQVRCAFFKGQQRHMNFKLANGMQILARAKVSLYQPRGDFQLIIDLVELAGDGKLQLKYEALKNRLSNEGLFDPVYKKDLPTLPRQIGVITSATGAAIRDILSVLQRRCPLVPVLIYPTAVQGEKAAAQIVASIQFANVHAACDVLILSRGGGSLEDLWPFNEEIVARAIFASALPIISGVGHEIDFTIADFVADRRAPTPSVAAEMVSPDQQQWIPQLKRYQERYHHFMRQHLQQRQQQLRMMQKRLRHPQQIIRDKIQTIDQFDGRLQQIIKQTLLHHKHLCQLRIIRLKQLHPENRLALARQQLLFLQQRLQEKMHYLFTQSQIKITQFSKALIAYNPLAILNRGYAVITDNAGHIVDDIDKVAINSSITATLANGDLRCQVVTKNYTSNNN